MALKKPNIKAHSLLLESNILNLIWLMSHRVLPSRDKGFNFLKNAQPSSAMPFHKTICSRRQFFKIATTASFIPLLSVQKALAERGIENSSLYTPIVSSGVITPTLMIAGSSNTAPSLWADRLIPPLSEIFETHAPLKTIRINGQDGVSGSNRFDAHTENEGDTVLLVPGAAVIAALAGDNRVHFDYGRWIPVLLCQQNQVIIGRKDIPSPFIKHIRNFEYRVAISNYIGPQLPTLLALHLLNFSAHPVPDLGSTDAALAALQSGHVDLIQLNESDFQRHRAYLEDKGFKPHFTLNTRGITDIPTFIDQYTHKLGKPPSGALYEGWKALATAATLETAMVLPMLTPSTHVAQWRHISERIMQNADIVHFAQDNMITLTNAHDSTVIFEQMTPSLSAQLAIKRWLTPLLAEWR